MKITPRFLIRAAGGSFRHVEGVQCEQVFALSGNPRTGEVMTRALLPDGPDCERAVWVEFTPEECERMHRFADEMVNGKPLEHAMSKRLYEWNMGGVPHKITIRGWHSAKGWHNAGEPECKTCSLPLVVAELVKTMARLSLPELALAKDSVLHWMV